VGGVATRFEYGAGGELIAEWNDADSPNKNVQKDYFYKGGELFATKAVGSSEYQFATSDHLGSPRAWTDGSGNLTAGGRHDYLPFGEELSAGVGIRSAALGYGADSARQKFTGKERDGETGLDFFLARYYSSVQGRFTSVDPLMASASVNEPQSWNRYVYVKNNPCKFIDPTGMQEINAEDCKKDSRCVSINVNIIYDTNANKGKGLTDKQKAQFEKEQLQKLKNEYGEALVHFEVAYSEGKLDRSTNKLTGLKDGAINVLVTTGNFPQTGEPEMATMLKSGHAVVGINMIAASEGLLSHGVAHHFLGHTTSRIGLAMQQNLFGSLFANLFAEGDVGRARMGLAILGRHGGTYPNALVPGQPLPITTEFHPGARSIQQYLLKQEANRPRQ
jgi:RHS repeat-associated protein